ncbi:MAG: hypothetical protein UV67_C0016G0016 [Parcubacteria group bacterium GW2011_GWC1_43_12]|nr:MAG: hypothetical protein UV67_C0016G0016 [Parcubacteria group bacterium GW2011_GWC1_43_12]
MKTIFLFIPNFVYASDLLCTDYIKYLSQKFKAVVFLPEGTMDEKHPYYASPNIVYLPWKIQFPKFWNLFGKILRYSLIRKFDGEPVLKRHHKRGFTAKRKFFRPFAYLFPKNFLTPDLFLKLETFFLPRSGKFKKYCAQYHPEIILTATPGFNHLDAEVIALAKKEGLKTAAVDFSWDNLFGGSKNLRKPDYLVVWNDIIKETAIKMHGFSPEKVFVSGVMRFDHYFIDSPGELSRADFLNKKGLDPSKKTILITTVTDGNYPLENELIARLLEARENGKIKNEPNFFIRLHPKDDWAKYERFLAQKNVAVEEAGEKRGVEAGSRIEMSGEDLANLKSTLKFCDLVINYASTITLEACVFDKPVINIGFPEKYLDAYEFSHYKPIVQEEAVKVAKSFNQMIEGINFYLANPRADGEKRRKITENFIKFTDGRSFRRNVDLAEKIISL